MENNGIQQRIVSEKTGICPEILNAILNGKRKMEVVEYYDICAAIQVSPTWIATQAGIYFVTK